MEHTVAQREKRYDLLIPAILFVALFLFKLIFVINGRSMPQVSDEFTYAKLSRLLLENGTYNSVQYPLVYPLYLIPAQFFGDSAYIMMKIMSAFSSSFVPVVVYMICRLYLGKKESALGAVFAAIIPFQYITSMTLMSENLYFPLFLLTIYVTLKKYRREVLADLLLGGLLGLLFMTRHITFVSIPVFLFGWLLKQLELKKDWKTVIARGMMVVAVLLLVYLPWVLMCQSYGYALKEIIGFKIASRTNPAQLTLKRLIMVAGFYLSYFSIILAPVLGLAFKSIRGLQFKGKTLYCAYNRLWVMVFGLAAAFFVAVTRHSWRAYYNFPEFEKIKGRYLIYFPILFVILGIVVLFKQKPKFKHAWVNLLGTYLLPVFMIVLGYFIDIKGLLYPLQSTFIGSIESSDGQKVKFMGMAFIAVIPLFILLYQYVYDFAKEKWQKSLFAVFAAGLLAVEIWGMPAYLDYMQGVDEKQNNTNNRYAQELMATLEMLEGPDTRYIYAENMPQFTFISRTLDFWQTENVVLTKDLNNIKGTPYYIFTDQVEKYADIEIRKVMNYNWKDQMYYLIEVN